MRRTGAPSQRQFGGILPVHKPSFVSPRNEVQPSATTEESTIPVSSKDDLDKDKLLSPTNSYLTKPVPQKPVVNPQPSMIWRKPMSDVNNRVEIQSDSIGVTSRFLTCVWCKKSGRKHKKWEGDAVIKVGTRSVVLIDLEGKEIGRGTGYKTAQLLELDEGGVLGVGGKEIEVMGVFDGGAIEWERLIAQGRKGNIKDKDVDLEKSIISPVSLKSESVSKPLFKPFRVPCRIGAAVDKFIPERTVQPGVPMFDPSRPGALVLPRPPPGHQLLDQEERLVDVVVDPFVGKHLRPHQKSGVVFLYSNLMGFSKVWTRDGIEITVTGAILADEMGLGKTLQTIVMVWTLLKQGPIAGCKTAKRILIVAPSSLLRNWEAEFRKWLGTERIVIHVADTGDKVARFKSYNTAPVLLISYEMLVRTVSQVSQISWDLVVCDEAHRLKNSQIKVSSCLSDLPCKRRLLLTGTPVQNDLGEYFSLVDTVCPGLLGSRTQFSKQVEDVVERGRQPGADKSEKEEGRRAMEDLELITRQLILRRTQEVINKFLPPKTVNVVFCRPTDYQARIYSREVFRLLDKVETDPGLHLAAISSLRKVCNAPGLLEDVPDLNGGGPPSWEEQSAKLATLTCFLSALLETGEEKMVLVSLSTSTLDLLSSLCDKYNLSHSRLDGNTPTNTRQQLVDRFNKSDTRVFLLSSKAGGTGLNLVGASRLVLYDVDWNPATDSQAMARVWRDGQQRHCHIYRLLTVGTIEEKMYQRQVMKSGLSNVGQVSTCAFSKEELRDLFTFREDTECDTHTLMECHCGGSGIVEKTRKPEEETRACQLGVQQVIERKYEGRMEELMSWRHITSPVEDKVDDPLLEAASSFITYMFSHTTEDNR